MIVRFYTLDRIPPDAPVYPAPLDGMSDLTLPLALWWTGAETDENQYRIQIDDIPSFDEPLLDESQDGTRFVIISLPAVGTYYWRLQLTNVHGTSDWSDVWSFHVASITSTEDELLPDRFALHSNYPNPFNSETTIRFDLPTADEVTLEIFDVLGRRVARLANGHLPAGRHQARWNADHLASGLYLYRLRAGSFVKSRTTILVK